MAVPRVRGDEQAINAGRRRQLIVRERFNPLGQDRNHNPQPDDIEKECDKNKSETRFKLEHCVLFLFGFGLDVSVTIVLIHIIRQPIYTCMNQIVRRNFGGRFFVPLAVKFYKSLGAQSSIPATFSKLESAEARYVMLRSRIVAMTRESFVKSPSVSRIA